MTTALEKRLEALEASHDVREPITIIRIVTLPGDVDAEPDRAEVGGKQLLRADGETGEAFLERVEAEAKLAAKPGCVRVALVFPRMLSDAGSVP